MQHSPVSPGFVAQVWECFLGGRTLFFMKRKPDTEEGWPWATDGPWCSCRGSKGESETGGSRRQGQSWARGSTGQGRARAGLRARRQSPHHWGERREGAVPQGSGGPGEACRGAAAAAASRGTARPLPGCDFAASTSLPLQATADFACA